MGIDQIEGEALGEEPADRPPGAPIEQEGGEMHAYLRQADEARMVDRDAMSDFASRRAGEAGIASGALAGAGKPRDRRDDPSGNTLRGEQVAQAVFDENSVVGLFGIGEKRGEGKNFHDDAK